VNVALGVPYRLDFAPAIGFVAPSAYSLTITGAYDVKITANYSPVLKLTAEKREESHPDRSERLRLQVQSSSNLINWNDSFRLQIRLHSRTPATGVSSACFSPRRHEKLTGAYPSRHPPSGHCLRVNRSRLCTVCRCAGGSQPASHGLRVSQRRKMGASGVWTAGPVPPTNRSGSTRRPQICAPGRVREQ